MTKFIDVAFAIAMLRDDNLVWSADFNSVRLPLADLIESMIVVIDAAEEMVASLNSPYASKLCNCGGNCGCK
jgi:hypothetical protein